MISDSTKVLPMEVTWQNFFRRMSRELIVEHLMASLSESVRMIRRTAYG